MKSFRGQGGVHEADGKEAAAARRQAGRSHRKLTLEEKAAAKAKRDAEKAAKQNAAKEGKTKLGIEHKKAESLLTGTRT